MSFVNPEDPQPAEPPRGHVRMVYLGPVAPHWEVESEFGDRGVIEEFPPAGAGAPRALAAHTTPSSGGIVSASSVTPSGRT